jgi:hypothetical protein
VAGTYFYKLSYDFAGTQSITGANQTLGASAPPPTTPLPLPRFDTGTGVSSPCSRSPEDRNSARGLGSTPIRQFLRRRGHPIRIGSACMARVLPHSFPHWNAAARLSFVRNRG